MDTGCLMVANVRGSPLPWPSHFGWPEELGADRDDGATLGFIGGLSRTSSDGPRPSPSLASQAL